MMDPANPSQCPTMVSDTNPSRQVDPDWCPSGGYCFEGIFPSGGETKVSKRFY